MPPGRDRWCHHVAPVTAVVACSGEQHRVTWRRGKVVLEDHDLAAETTMLAFGGERCACLQVLQLWRNLHSWAMSAELFRQMQSRLGPGRLLAPGDLAQVHELGLLLTWERRWRRSAFFSDQERLLHEQLARRALGPLREHLTVWRQRHGCRMISQAEVQVARPGQPAALHGTMDAVAVKATALLGTVWALTVWARGLALVDGAFVLDILDQGEAPGELRVRAARWERQRGDWAEPRAAPATLRRGDEGGWRLDWDDAG